MSAFLLLFPVLLGQEAPTVQDALQVIELVHFQDGREAAKSRLEAAARSLRGEVTDAETVVTASLETGEDGFVKSYRRSVRATAPDRLIARVSIEWGSSGCTLREQGPMGGRSRDIPGGRVHAVLDPAWPEALIFVLGERKEGFLSVFFVASAEVRTVEVKSRPGGARYLDLPGGGITWEGSEEKGFTRLVLPGTDNQEIVRKGAPAGTGVLPDAVAEEETTFKNGEIDVPATLTRPKGLAGPGPAVILLADAGPCSRDGDPPGFRDGLLRELAHRLAQAGYVSLRYEKRDGRDDGAGWAELKSDLVAAAQWLGAREGVRKGCLAALGHGEGGLLALAVAGDQPELFRALVLLAAPVRPLPETLEARLGLRLRGQGENEETIQRAIADLRKDLDAVRKLDPAEDPGPGRRLLRDLLAFEPLPALDKVAALPVLLMQGAADPEVPPEHQVLLRTTLALGRAAKHRLQVLEMADHVFKKTESDRPQDAVRAGGADVARPFHPDLVPILKAFLDEVLGGAAGGK